MTHPKRVNYITNQTVSNFFMPLPPPAFEPARPARAKRERRKDARPGELLEAALDLFVEKGFAATRSEEVAARAGVAKGTLFLYFQSKEELFKAVVRENLSGRFGEWNQELEAFEGSTPDMLRYVLRMWWERVGATKVSGIAKLMLSEGGNFPELANFYQREVVQPCHALLRRVLQRGIDRGEFVLTNLDLAVYTVVAPMVFLMLCQHSSSMCLNREIALDPQQFIALQVEIVLHGLCAPAATEAPPKIERLP